MELEMSAIEIRWKIDTKSSNRTVVLKASLKFAFADDGLKQTLYPIL